VTYGKTAEIERAHASRAQRNYCSKRSLRGHPRDLRQSFATSDFAEIQIDYQPGDRCLETKSLKFYLASYRSERAFNEAVTNQILNDLVRACDPRQMSVRADFAARGGISLRVTATYPDEMGGAAR
jgi:7-cyano-7-deazaguanine reductase